MSLPILEGDNFGKDVSVCLSPLSEQPLNLWGSLGIQLGVVAQQGDRGRREFDLFCACSCSGSFGLAPAQRGCLGSGRNRLHSQLWAVPAWGHTALGAGDTWGHTCVTWAPRGAAVTRFGDGWGLVGEGHRLRGAVVTVLSSATELSPMSLTDTNGAVLFSLCTGLAVTSLSLRFVSVAGCWIFSYWSTKSLVSVLFWTVCVSLCKGLEFSHRGKSWK